MRDRRADMKARRARQKNLVEDNMGLSDEDLATLAIQEEVFATSNRDMVIYMVARLRRIIDLERRGILPAKPTWLPRALESVAKWLPTNVDEKAALTCRKEAFRAMSLFLQKCGWTRAKAATPLEMTFWKDAEGPAIHRLDTAFFVANQRYIERERLRRKSSGS